MRASETSGDCACLRGESRSKSENVRVTVMRAVGVSSVCRVSPLLQCHGASLRHIHPHTWDVIERKNSKLVRWHRANLRRQNECA